MTNATTTTTDIVVIDGQVFALADVAANPRRLLELYADRCRDLAYEYEGRVAAEDACELWRDVATVYADHTADCAIVPGQSETCTCGYSRYVGRAIQTDYERAKPPTPYARLVALGRAALAYERHRGTPAGAALRQPYLDALRACEAQP